MSNEKDNGGPAFPTRIRMVDASEGMTLRDYFAAKAPPEEVNTIMVYAGWTNITGSAWLERITAARMMWADAMLEARNS